MALDPAVSAADGRLQPEQRQRALRAVPGAALARPLSTDVPGTRRRRTSATATRPPSAELQIAMAPGKLDALDFLSLSGCQLQVTLGQAQQQPGEVRAAPRSGCCWSWNICSSRPRASRYLRSRDEAGNRAAAGIYPGRQAGTATSDASSTPRWRSQEFHSFLAKIRLALVITLTRHQLGGDLGTGGDQCPCAALAVGRLSRQANREIRAFC